MPLEVLGRVDDPTNIVGLGHMMQGDDVDSNVDWNILEKQIIGDIGINYNPEKEQSKLSDDYAMEIQRLSNSYGVNGHNQSDVKSNASNYGDTSNNLYSEANQPSSPFKNLNLSAPQCKPVTDINSERPYSHSNSYSSKQYDDPQLRNMTHEQQNKHIIHSVIGSLGADEVSSSSNSQNGIADSLSREREMDRKIRMLEQIDALKQSLKEDNIDTERIEKVSRDNDIHEVEQVLKHFLVVSDNKRCSGLAEDCILMGAQGAGYILDGQRRIMGRRPDLTDWHKTVAVKLRHLRHDTSMLVSGVMKKYNVGHGLRIMMELIPSMLYHSTLRSKKSEKDYISDAEYNNALGTIRDI
jgi:hypothetical protein